MPARAERIYIFSAQADQPGRVMGFPVWWDRTGFFEKYRDRQIDLGHPAYVDYAFLLTPGEALAFDERCREKFYTDPSSRRPHVVSDMQRLQSALKGARWVIVESYEWESGLD
jgi:hypothetical protein